MIVFGGVDGGLTHQCPHETTECKAIITEPQDENVGIEIDRCILPDLKILWAHEIRTECSCCGHGNAGAAFICVIAEDADKARSLGYDEIPRRYEHCEKCGVFFAPKEARHGRNNMEL